MPSRRLSKPILNSGGIIRQGNLFLRIPVNLEQESDQGRSARAALFVADVERRSLYRRLVPFGGSIVALTAAALIVGSIKGGWVSAATLGLIALGQCVAFLAPNRPTAEVLRNQ
ncbi:hypothetical protein [Schlesneria paludicola]|uniref:hypothetical protein n=1 Tax=Schlesneria paludicola TaxID=360056 RepID=UPI000299E803|nr:hypothetical protein [Schlesneria paludicola]